MENPVDHVERLLADSNKDQVTLIGDGLSKQHFVELEAFIPLKGKLYQNQVKNSWNEETEKRNSNNFEKIQIFSTEVSEKVFLEAKNRIAANQENKEIEQDLANGVFLGRSFLKERAQEIKQDLLIRGSIFYEKALENYKNGNFEKALLNLEKGFSFNSFNVDFFLLKADSYIQICDFKSAISTINKLLSVLAIYFDQNDSKFNSLKTSLHDKIAFCYYMMGQTYYDSKLYLEALDCFNKACDIRPNNLTFKIKSISCLYAMNRLPDTIDLMDKIINENELNKNNSNLYVLRARLYLKENNVSKCFHDLKSALKLEPSNKEATTLMEQLENTAEQLRNGGLILSLSNRVNDALNKLSGAIAFNPGNPEYNLQRGILYKRLKDFNSAIDDFLLGLEKINEYEIKDPDLHANFQRQILLTYNDFAIQCYEKRFYDDAIVLLNKAIKIEKTEKGFYVNRGDCFYKKDDKRFALLDYEQAHEIDPNDEEIKDRIAKLYYEFAIEKYDEKNYKEATNYFNQAINMMPNKCKYYISRARTRFFSNERYEAQIDICISILLEPSNPEIPGIISRIFVNQNLNEVLESNQMEEAKNLLKEMNIKTIFDLDENLTDNLNIITENDKQKFRMIPNLDEVLIEEEENLKIIEEKKKINRMIKESLKINLKPNVPKLGPLKIKKDNLKRGQPCGINLRK